MTHPREIIVILEPWASRRSEVIFIEVRSSSNSIPFVVPPQQYLAVEERHSAVIWPGGVSR